MTCHHSTVFVSVCLFPEVGMSLPRLGKKGNMTENKRKMMENYLVYTR